MTKADQVALPKELMGMYWLSVANLFACSVVDEEDVSGQGLVSQARTSIHARGVVYDSTKSKVAFGDVNVHVDALVVA